MTNISFSSLAAVYWRPRPGASSLRGGFLGTGVLGAGIGAEPRVAAPKGDVDRAVPRVPATFAASPARMAVVPALHGQQTNNYMQHKTGAYATGEGASGPPPRGDSA